MITVTAIQFSRLVLEEASAFPVPSFFEGNKEEGLAANIGITADEEEIVFQCTADSEDEYITVCTDFCELGAHIDHQIDHTFPATDIVGDVALDPAFAQQWFIRAQFPSTHYHCESLTTLLLSETYYCPRKILSHLLDLADSFNT